MAQKRQKYQSKRSITTLGRSLSRLVALIVAILVVAMATYLGLEFRDRVIASNAAEERSQAMGLSSEEVTDEEKDAHTVDGVDKPKLISIPATGVDRARVQEIGLLQPGSSGSQQMDAPVNVHDVGWYNCQINPVASKACSNYVSPAGINNTEVAAVMDGHSCSGNGCVFDGLQNLQSGDEIILTMGDDSTITYVVDRVDIVDLADMDMKQAMSVFQPGVPGLNLITCDGSWSSVDSRGVRTMDQRVVVYSSIKL